MFLMFDLWPPGRQGPVSGGGVVAPPPGFSALRSCETLTARSLRSERRAPPAVTALINLGFNDTNLSPRRGDASQDVKRTFNAREQRSPLSQLRGAL